MESGWLIVHRVYLVGHWTRRRHALFFFSPHLLPKFGSMFPNNIDEQGAFGLLGGTALLIGVL